MHHKNLACWYALPALVSACAPDLPAPSDHVEHVDAQHTSSEAPRSASEVIIDASDHTRWVYFDLEARATVEPPDPEDSSAWDLAFRRYQIKLNGGVSGTGTVSATRVADRDYDALQTAPGGPYATDQADGPDEDEDPEYALSTGDGAWYRYDMQTHTLTPQPHVYVVRARGGAYYKLQVLGYYNDAGSAGYVRFRYAPVGAPSGEPDPPPRAGPEGCYVPADAACDCQLSEADCEPEGGIWTDGCQSCGAREGVTATPPEEPVRQGPEGCYIPEEMACDCELVERDCTDDVGVWTAGCTSCE